MDARKNVCVWVCTRGLPAPYFQNRCELIDLFDTTVVHLLDKIEFSTADGDHLILTGDLINKGPDSTGVVDLARDLGASCVRGNHEDRILLLRHEIEAQETSPANDKTLKSHEPSDKETKELKLARSLSADQVKWLDACPVILNVGQIPDMGQVVVVHAGLVPGVELEKQDPSTAMTMRTIDLDTHFPSPSNKGIAWAKVSLETLPVLTGRLDATLLTYFFFSSSLFSLLLKMFEKHQSMLYSSLKSTHKDPRSQTMTVIYGHDAKTGLKVRTYSKGLDSGCVKGGQLTALVIEDGGKQTLVQVNCKNDYTATKESKEKHEKA